MNVGQEVSRTKGKNVSTITQEISRKPRGKFYHVFAVNPENNRRVQIANTRKTTQGAAEKWAVENASLIQYWSDSVSTSVLLSTPTVITVR